jgi:hypothetical protein
MEYLSEGSEKKDSLCPALVTSRVVDLSLRRDNLQARERYNHRHLTIVESK